MTLGFWVYTRMRRLPVVWTALLWIGVIVSVAFAGVLSPVHDTGFVITAIATFVLVAVGLALWVISVVRGYSRFKTFPGDLAIPFEGWDELVRDEKMHAGPDQWRACCEIEVRGDLDAAVIAMLDQFVLVANRNQYYVQYYDRGGSPDARTPWKRAGHTASGSFNIATIGDIYRLVRALDTVRVGGVVARVSGPTYRYTKK